MPRPSLTGLVLTSFEGTEERTLDEIKQFVSEKFGIDPDEVEKLVMNMAQNGVFLTHVGEGRYRRKTRDDFQDIQTAKGFVSKKFTGSLQSLISQNDLTLFMVALVLLILSGVKFEPGVNPLAMLAGAMLLAFVMKLVVAAISRFLAWKSKPRQTP